MLKRIPPLRGSLNHNQYSMQIEGKNRQFHVEEIREIFDKADWIFGDYVTFEVGSL